MLAGVRGQVVEVGPGNGINFAHYPPDVAEFIAVEPEPYLRAQAQDVAATAPIPIRVVDGLADALGLATGSADAIVISGVLCSVPDQLAALAEFRRVLRPGGELRFYEHARAAIEGLRNGSTGSTPSGRAPWAAVTPIATP